MRSRFAPYLFYAKSCKIARYSTPSVKIRERIMNRLKKNFRLTKLHFRLNSVAIIMVSLLAAQALRSQDAKHLELDSSFASFVEDDFPFFTQTLDCRKLGDDWPKDNLTPRGIILKLGGGYYACFDIDLLRVALVWKESEKGEYLSMSGMAPGSYRLPNKKASAGQKSLPTPIGKPIAANGLYPGWGEKKDLRDRKGADPDEPGLGPGKGMKWKGIVNNSKGVSLKYEVDGVDIEEFWSGDGSKNQNCSS